MTRFFIFTTLIVIFFLWKSCSSDKDIEPIKESTVEKKTSMATEIPIAKPIEEKKVSGKIEEPSPSLSTETKKDRLYLEEEKKPLDSFDLRNLDLPQPQSIEELLKKITDFKEPELPDDGSTDYRPGDRDGDLLAIFRGYYEFSDGKFKKMQVDHSTDRFKISIENQEGNIDSWSDKNQQLVRFNFDNDPYGLVTRFPNGDILYTKFYTDISVPSYQSTYRALKGWMIPKKSERTAIKVILIDGPHYGLEDPSGENSYRWPELEALKKIIPSPLPAK